MVRVHRGTPRSTLLEPLTPKPVSYACLCVRPSSAPGLLGSRCWLRAPCRRPHHDTNARTAAEEHAIGWDTTPHEFISQWTKGLSSEQDPRSLIRRFVEADTRIKARLTPLVIGLGGSMPPDAEPARDRESGRDRFFGSLVDRLAELGALPSGLGRRHALDITRALNQQQAYSDLTRRRGWSDEEWSAWMTDLLSSQLLR